MSGMPCKKNKVVLSDFNYRRDIDIRLLIAQLNPFELAVLREILDHSLQIPLKNLVESLNTTGAKLVPLLNHLSSAKLLKCQGENIVVDKEMRKFFEAQMMKIDEDFEPGMEYLQGLLNKIPHPILAQWYAIPRNCDHFFQTIVDKYMTNPRVYERYIQDICFDDEILNKITRDVFAAPDFSVRGADIMKKYRLTHEQFEEAILFLEYNFIGCLSYQKSGDHWEEVVAPFHEWRQYLRFRTKTAPQTIVNHSQISVYHEEEFGFIKDLTRLIEAAKKKPLTLQRQALPAKEVAPLLAVTPSSKYLQSLLDKILFLHLGEIRGNQLHLLDPADEWIKKPLQEKALLMSRHPIQVEKGLRQVVKSNWVYVDDFLKGFTGALSGKEPIALRQKGKRWKYELPEYSKEELDAIATTICDRFFEAGLVDVGTHEGRPCFRVTPFGRMTLDE